MASCVHLMCCFPIPTLSALGEGLCYLNESAQMLTATVVVQSMLLECDVVAHQFAIPAGH